MAPTRPRPPLAGSERTQLEAERRFCAALGAWLAAHGLTAERVTVLIESERGRLSAAWVSTTGGDTTTGGDLTGGRGRVQSRRELGRAANTDRAP